MGSAATLVSARPVKARTPVGLNPNRVIFFYNSNFGGSHGGTGSTNVPVLTNNFVTSGNGEGLPVKNNAASVKNTWSGGHNAYVYSEINYVGAANGVSAGGGINLSSAVKNHNRSVWVPYNS